MPPRLKILCLLLPALLVSDCSSPQPSIEEGSGLSEAPTRASAGGSATAGYEADRGNPIPSEVPLTASPNPVRRP